MKKSLLLISLLFSSLSFAGGGNNGGPGVCDHQALKKTFSCVVSKPIIVEDLLNSIPASDRMIIGSWLQAGVTFTVFGCKDGDVLADVIIPGALPLHNVGAGSHNVYLDFRGSISNTDPMPSVQDVTVLLEGKKAIFTTDFMTVENGGLHENMGKLLAVADCK